MASEKKRLDLSPIVFWGSTIIILGLIVLTLSDLENAALRFDAAKRGMTASFGWFFVAVTNTLVLLSVFIAVSRAGKIRLGGPEARPEFSRLSWYAMLFSAGMGIGLIFWSVAEPIYHYATPPRSEPETPAAAREAMGLTFFHWGLHAWAIYGIVSLALGYFSFNRGLPLTIRSAFYPLLRERIHGPIGHAIDILAVVATLFGVTTSLGLGVQQINAGLAHLFGVPQSSTVQVVLIAIITAIATLSVVSGVGKGIRILSEFNLKAAAVLLFFVLITGPTLYILDGLIQNIGYYIQNLVRLSSWTETYSVDESGEQTTWQHGWTIFYWAWWIAWSPFVGMFIARISRGRTVRELLCGVLLVPCALTFFWLTVFGNAALYEEMFGAGGISQAVQNDVAVAIFELLERYPLGHIASGLATLVVVTFFVTSSDSGSLVIDIITSGGKTDPPVIQRIYWAVMEGVVAAVLLVAGGLGALQTASITTGLPFAVILLIMSFSLIKELRKPTALQKERGDSDPTDP